VKAGRAAAKAVGVDVRREERVVPLGTRWLIRAESGFEPCPWAFALARFASARPGDRVLDLGCGGGVLLCALAQVCPEVRALIGVELNPVAAELARRNLTLNDLPGAIVVGDVRSPPIPPRAFDLVVSNPPFYPAGWGRESADRATHAATHRCPATSATSRTRPPSRSPLMGARPSSSMQARSRPCSSRSLRRASRPARCAGSSMTAASRPACSCSPGGTAGGSWSTAPQPEVSTRLSISRVAPKRTARASTTGRVSGASTAVRSSASRTSM